MSFQSASQFKALTTALGNHLLTAAAQFSRDLNLGAFDVAALGQMSAQFEDTCKELVMFGCDVWPLPDLALLIEVAA